MHPPKDVAVPGPAVVCLQPLPGEHLPLYVLPPGQVDKMVKDALVGADGGGSDFVERMFIFFLRICPFAVAIDLGRCLHTRSEVRPGQVVNNPASMATIQVEGTGLKAAWWRYTSKSRSVFWVYVLLACSGSG